MKQLLVRDFNVSYVEPAWCLLSMLLTNVSATLKLTIARLDMKICPNMLKFHQIQQITLRCKQNM